jgi:hypothetical protein
MSSDSISDRREQGLLDRVDRQTVGIVVVLLAVVAVGAVALVLSGGGSGGSEDGTPDTGLDYVPQSADAVVQINGSATEDELILETLSGGDGGNETGLLDAAWWLVNNGQAPSVTELLSIIGDDSVGYETTTAFFGSGNETAYAGAVVEVENDSSAVVDLVEEEVGNLSETEYSGVTVQEITAGQAAQQADVAAEYDLTGLLTQFVGSDTKAWVATLDNGTAALGSKAAVQDVIDIDQGNTAGLSPDSKLRTAHGRIPPGKIELTVNTTLFPEETPLRQLARVIDTQIAAGLELTAGSGQEVELLSGSYTPRDETAGTATLHAQVKTPDPSGAQSLINQFDGFLGEQQRKRVNDSLEAIRTLPPSERASANRSGAYVTLEIPETPDRVIGYVADIVDEFAPQFLDRTPADLVPRTVDDTNVTRLDATPTNVTVSNATVFYGPNGYVGTVAELDREAFFTELNRTDSLTRIGDYRETDVFELTGAEPATTESLTGPADPNTEWVARLGSGFVVFGSEAAVKDSIDIYRGVAAPK